MKSKVRELEQAWEMSIEDILTEVIETTDTQAEAAQRLGVNQSTISNWLSKLHLRVIRRVEPVYIPTGKTE